MIKKYERNPTGNYFNILQVVWLFIATELLEILIYFGAYDPTTAVFNMRKVFWVSFLILSIIGIATLIGFTCVTLIIAVLTGIIQ